jgi:hypothetical protein
MSEWLRWKLWGLITRLPRMCPSNAHTAIVLTHPGRNRGVFVDRACRRDCAVNSTCWCGKLRQAVIADGDR